MENELNESPLLRNLRRESSENGSPEPPDGYFESFSARLQSRLSEAETAPLLHNLPHTTPAVDEAYFSALPDRLTDAAILSDAPLLTQIPRLHPAVPEGYFEHLPAQLLAQVTQYQPIVGRIRMLGNPAVRYAIAASLGILLAAGGWLWLQPAPGPAPQPLAVVVTEPNPQPAPQEKPSPAVVSQAAEKQAYKPKQAPKPPTTSEALNALSQDELLAIVGDHTTSASVEDVVGEDALVSLTNAADMLQFFSPDDVNDLLDGLILDDYGI